MGIETFWELVRGSLEHAPGRSAREEYVKVRLEALSPADIVQFQAQLNRALSHAYTWDLWGAAARIFGGRCSDDGFEYFRLWLIGQGRDVFESAIAVPDSLAAFPQIQRLAGRHLREWDNDTQWPEWETLAYIAEHAYRLATGDDDECGERFHDSVNACIEDVALQRKPAGEYWAAHDEALAALRLPNLAPMFPTYTARC